MAKNIDDLLPSADEIMKKIALAEAEKAAESFRKHAQAEAGKRAEMARLAGPSGLSEDEKVQLAAKVIRRAIDSGRTEMQVYRFTNQLCTDHGRAINQKEPGWEKTLTGIPKEIDGAGGCLSELDCAGLALPFAAHAYLIMSCPFRITHPRLSHRHSVYGSLPIVVGSTLY